MRLMRRYPSVIGPAGCSQFPGILTNVLVGHVLPGGNDVTADVPIAFAVYFIAPFDPYICCTITSNTLATIF